MSDRTTQLRRYEIVPEHFDEFVTWMRERLMPAREAAGFTLEWAYANPEEFEFTWAVSAPGDHERFGELTAAWMSSPARDAAFAGVPEFVTAQHVALVEVVA